MTATVSPAPNPEPFRWWNHSGFIKIVAATVGIILAILLADRLFPPDLSRYRDRSLLVLDRQGGTLRAFLTRDGAWRLETGPTDVTPTYLALLKSYEDHRFDDHVGVDPLALSRAVTQAIRRGRVVSGGSTLTMQVARLLELRPRTLGSKIVEMVRAVQLEARFSKDQILGMYLTLAPFGGNLEGVRAASLAWFGREPGQLTLGQAALLVALPQSPTARRPDLSPDAARRGRDQVLDRLVALGRLSESDAADARQEPVPDRRRPLPFIAPHLADRLRRDADGQGGTLVSSIDPTLQRQAEMIAASARQFMEPEAEVALLLIENANGAVRAYVGGSFDGPMGQLDMIQAVRSPGSALKPLIYALGFEALPLHPDTRLDDRPIAFGNYRPGNFDGTWHGTVTARTALQQSLNIPAIGILSRLGPTWVQGRLDAAGARLVQSDPNVAPGLPLALGGIGIRAQDLALLYTALARGGSAQPLRLLEKAPVPEALPLVDAASAWYVADILSGAPRPDGRAGTGGDGAGVFAYKTGTSYGFRDAWSVGFTRRYTALAWVGRPDGTPRPGIIGRDAAAPLLFRLVDLLPAEPTTAPPPDVLRLAPGDLLPAGLQHLELDPQQRRHLARTRPSAGLTILFPPDGAEVDLATDQPDPEPLALEAEGGTAPLRWLVNGLPVPDIAGGTPLWHPDGPGYADILVIDGDGRQARVTVKVR